MPRQVAMLAVVVVAIAAGLAIAFAGQPPLDLHSFRQTQTLIPAYWFTREGYKLIYETPVGGYPWAIPFEFPLYQFIVAAISQMTGVSLSVVGRLVSFTFLLLCLPVVRSITRRLELPPVVFAYFAVLTFSAPVYIYWGRAALIETTALFLVLLAVKFFLDYLLGGRALQDALLFSLFMTLGILQKVTTALPVLILLCIVLAAVEAGNLRSTGWRHARRWVTPCLFILFPLAAGYLWIHIADAVKQANPLGKYLTSAVLFEWNWGTLSQRFSKQLWLGVIGERLLMQNLGSFVGIVLVVASFLAPVPRKVKWVVAIATALGLLPLLMFPNLHIEHTYYQSAQLIFLIYGAAVALGAAIQPLIGSRAALIVLTGMTIANYVNFSLTYLPFMRMQFDRSITAVAVGNILHRELSPQDRFVVFTDGYSAVVAYLSERKSFTVPEWFKEMAQVREHPEDYVEKGQLGAVVSCTDASGFSQLMNWASRRAWKVDGVGRCAIATPERQFAGQAAPGACQGAIDRITLEGSGREKFIALGGWTATPARGAADEVYLMLAAEGKPPLYLEALRVPRLDGNIKLGASADADFGFFRVLPGSVAPGSYTIRVVQRTGGKSVVCPFRQQIELPG